MFKVKNNFSYQIMCLQKQKVYFTSYGLSQMTSFFCIKSRICFRLKLSNSTAYSNSKEKCKKGNRMGVATRWLKALQLELEDCWFKSH